MALVERLCQTYEVDDYPLNIALNPFCESLMSVLGNYHTVSQVKAFYSMSAEDETEMDAMVDRITDYPQKTDRMLATHRIRSILTFWEQGNIPGYMTVAEIRSQLNAI